jgi:hypothetical protein
MDDMQIPGRRDRRGRLRHDPGAHKLSGDLPAGHRTVAVHNWDQAAIDAVRVG